MVKIQYILFAIEPGLINIRVNMLLKRGDISSGQRFHVSILKVIAFIK